MPHSREVRQRVLQKKAEGLSYAEIAQQVRISRSTVQGIVQQGRIKPRKSSGRPTIVTKKVAQFILNIQKKLIERGERATSSKIKENFQEKISLSTIQRYLKRKKEIKRKNEKLIQK